MTIDSVANALNQITCIGDTAPACTGGTSTTHDAPRAKARILKVPPDN